MFRHDCPLAVKPASTSRRLVHKKLERFSTYWYVPLAWPSRLLYRRGRKSGRDLWITLYFRFENRHNVSSEHTCNTSRTVHTVYTATFRFNANQQNGCRTPHAATQNLTFLMGVNVRNMSSYRNTNELLLLHQVANTQYFLIKMHGQTSLKFQIAICALNKSYVPWHKPNILSRIICCEWKYESKIIFLDFIIPDTPFIIVSALINFTLWCVISYDVAYIT
jgi:hypothetical protein